MDDAYSKIGEDLFKFLLNIEKKIITILLNSNSTQIHSKMMEDVWYSEMNSRIWIHFWYWKKKKKIEFYWILMHRSIPKWRTMAWYSEIGEL